MDPKALQKLWDMADEGFFKKYPSRATRIRKAHEHESIGEFWSLGPHERNRRHIIMWRPMPGHPSYKKEKCPLLKIPFLAFADETIEDRDEVLLPIIAEIMKDERERQRR